MLWQRSTASCGKRLMISSKQHTPTFFAFYFGSGTLRRSFLSGHRILLYNFENKSFKINGGNIPSKRVNNNLHVNFKKKNKNVLLSLDIVCVLLRITPYI